MVGEAAERINPPPPKRQCCIRESGSWGKTQHCQPSFLQLACMMRNEWATNVPPSKIQKFKFLCRENPGIHTEQKTPSAFLRVCADSEASSHHQLPRIAPHFMIGRCRSRHRSARLLSGPRSAIRTCASLPLLPCCSVRPTPCSVPALGMAATALPPIKRVVVVGAGKLTDLRGERPLGRSSSLNSQPGQASAD